MTDQQIQSLQTLAKKVKSDKAKMPMLEVINRIHFLATDKTGMALPMSRCIEGYRLMREKQFLPSDFIAEDAFTETAYLEKFRTTELSILLDKFGCVFINTDQVRPAIAEPQRAPIAATVEQIASSFKLEPNF